MEDTTTAELMRSLETDGLPHENVNGFFYLVVDDRRDDRRDYSLKKFRCLLFVGGTELRPIKLGYEHAVVGREYIKFEGFFKLIAIHNGGGLFENDKIIFFEHIDNGPHAIVQAGEEYFALPLVLDGRHRVVRITPIENNVKFEKSPDYWYMYDDGWYCTGPEAHYRLMIRWTHQSLVNNDAKEPKLISPETGEVIKLLLLTMVFSPTTLKESQSQVEAHIEEKIKKKLTTQIPKDVIGLYHEQEFDTYHVHTITGIFAELNFESGFHTKPALKEELPQ
jgi:hypothetical protein